RSPKKLSVEYAVREARSEFEIMHEIAVDESSIRCARHLEWPGKNRFRRQVRRAHRVVEAFACDRVHEPRRVSGCDPSVTGHAIPIPRRRLQTRQQVAVERRTLLPELMLFHVLLEHRAHRRSRRSLAANSDGKMAAAREYPDVSFEAGQEL